MHFKSLILAISGLIIFIPSVMASPRITLRCYSNKMGAYKKFETESRKVVDNVDKIWRCGRKHYKKLENSSGYENCIKDLKFDQHYEKLIVKLQAYDFADVRNFSQAMTSIGSNYCLHLSVSGEFPIVDYNSQVSVIEPNKILNFDDEDDSNDLSSYFWYNLTIGILVVLLLSVSGVAIWLGIRLKALQPSEDPKDENLDPNASIMGNPQQNSQQQPQFQPGFYNPQGNAPIQTPQPNFPNQMQQFAPQENNFAAASSSPVLSNSGSMYQSSNPSSQPASVAVASPAPSPAQFSPVPYQQYHQPPTYNQQQYPQGYPNQY